MTTLPTPENWRSIVGFPDYDVSDLGRIRSWLPWRNTTTPRLFHPKKVDGYCQATLQKAGGDKSTVKVSVLVAATWIGSRPAGLVVAHGNGDRSDDRAENLAYKTQTANWADMVVHDTAPRGERHPCAKLTEADVQAIRLSPRGDKVLAEQYGVTKATIYQARTRRTWKFVT